MILVIAQSPALYAKIQEECDSIPSSDVNSYRLDLSPAVLSEKAPYLMSSLQEVLRLFSYIQAIRQVKEDCVLSSGTDHVQLRKGTRVVTSQRLVNVDTAVFGADALAFQGDRFIRNPKLQREFNTFGGGSSLCSGRHFAIPEIAGFVCLFFRGFSCDASGLVMMGVHDAPMKAQSMAIVDADETHIDGKWSGRLVDGKATGSGVMRPLCDNWLPIKPRGDILRFD
jgi:cytochrome P450